MPPSSCRGKRSPANRAVADIAARRLTRVPVRGVDLRRLLRAIWAGGSLPHAGAARDLLAHVTAGRIVTGDKLTRWTASCEATVLALLSESAVAAQDGYGGGLSPQTVLARYGEESAVFQAWSQLDGQVLAAQEEHGPDGLLAPFVPQVIALCRQYGGS